MAAPRSGRPVILDKAALKLGEDSEAQLRLVGAGDLLQIDLPAEWRLETVATPKPGSGARNKLVFRTDAPSTNGHAEPVAEPVATEAPAPAAKRTRRAAAPQPEPEPTVSAPVEDTAPKRTRRPRRASADVV